MRGETGDEEAYSLGPDGIGLPPAELAEEEEFTLVPIDDEVRGSAGVVEEQELGLAPDDEEVLADNADAVEEEVISIVPEVEQVDLFASPERTAPDREPTIPTGKPEDLFAEVVPDTTHSEQEKKRSHRGRRKKNEWDSPLLLIGGGSLIALLVGGLFIAYLLNREDADKILEQAATYFDGGSYTQAIAQYEKFVTHFPNHSQVSAAKVHLGIARLWKATQNSRQYEKALATARQVLENIEEEAEFGLAQEDLASLLPAIATGLAANAEQSTDPKNTDRLVERAKSALSLCTNTKYIAKTYRDENTLQEVQAALGRVERRRMQDVDLQQALLQIDQTIAANETTEAYAIHKQLLDKHPSLLGNESLSAKVLEITQSEQKVVRYVPEQVAAMTTEQLPP